MDTWFLTWTTYGTWLPGDERGYVGKTLTGKGSMPTANRPAEPYAYNHGLTMQMARKHLKRPPVRLSPQQAAIVAAAMQEAADRNGIRVIVGAVMADHCHVVVVADPSWALNVLKGATGFALSRLSGTKGLPWWTRGGKKDLVKSDVHLANVIRYVKNQKDILALLSGG